MSSQLMSQPRLAVWDESYFRGAVAPPTDVLVWPSVPAHRAGTAAAAVLTVGALSGVVVIAQAMVTGAIPVPVALGPALSAIPNAAVDAPTAAEVNPGPSMGSPSDSRTVSPELVRDSGLPGADGSAGYHRWQPPRLTDGPKSSWSDAGHHAVPEPRHSSQATPGRSTASWIGHRSGARTGWVGSRDADTPAPGRPDGGRHRAGHTTGDDGTQAGDAWYETAGWHLPSDRGPAAGTGGHDVGGRSSHRGGDDVQGGNGARGSDEAHRGGVHGGDGVHDGGAHRGGAYSGGAA